MNERGIILPIKEFGTDRSTGVGIWTKNDINQLELRKYLLYWDKIDWPTIDLLDKPTGIKEIELLIEEGCLRRTIYKTYGILYLGDYGADKLKILSQLNAFFINNRSKNEEWVMSQPDEIPNFPKQHFDYRKSVEVALYSCLPTPAVDTEIEDILEFKQKFSSELIEFRSVMDELYLEVIKSNDIPRAKIRAIQKIEKSISNVEKILNERKISYFLSSLKINLNLNDSVLWGSAGLGIGSSFGMPLIGSTIGALFSAIDFKIDLMPKPKNLPQHLKSFAVLNKVSKRLR